MIERLRNTVGKQVDLLNERLPSCTGTILTTRPEYRQRLGRKCLVLSLCVIGLAIASLRNTWAEEFPAGRTAAYLADSDSWMSQGSRDLPVDEAFQADLANTRALPFGYTAEYDKDAMKIRSRRSATFIIPDRGLCRFWRTYKKHESTTFLLCSNDPEMTDANPQPVPKCAGLPQRVVERGESIRI